MHTFTRALAAVAVAAVLCQPSTAWAQAGANVVIALSHTGNFTVGVEGIYTIVVSNIGDTASSSGLQVTTSFANGAGFGTGSGWTCFHIILSVHVPPQVLCMSGASIPPGGSAPPITVPDVPQVPGTVTNSVTVVSGSGTATASDITIVLPAVPTLPQWALIALTVCLALAGIAALRRRRT